MWVGFASLEMKITEMVVVWTCGSCLNWALLGRLCLELGDALKSHMLPYII